MLSQLEAAGNAFHAAAAGRVPCRVRAATRAFGLWRFCGARALAPGDQPRQRCPTRALRPVALECSLSASLSVCRSLARSASRPRATRRPLRRNRSATIRLRARSRSTVRYSRGEQPASSARRWRRSLRPHSRAPNSALSRRDSPFSSLSLSSPRPASAPDTPPDACAAKLNVKPTSCRVHIDGGKYIGIPRTDGSFVVHDVPAGTRTCPPLPSAAPYPAPPSPTDPRSTATQTSWR